MRNLLMAVLTVVAAIAGCGDNKPGIDGTVHHDGGNPDAPKFPAPPTLGAQIDRAGRPLVSTALIGAFTPAGPGKTAIKDAYNHASDPAAWTTTILETGVTIEAALRASLAVFDALDTGTALLGAGCGNALHYNGGPKPSSYMFAADLFADDELHVDTSRTSCTVYFSLELESVSGGTLPHTTCGGRMPSHAVVDVTYSVLAAGTSGLDGPANDFAPKLHGALIPHTDVKETTFPFLGSPR